jgi:2-iminobutanoate/2-iminopropanoate deaminase
MMHGEFEYNGKEYIDMKQISTTNAPAAIGPYSQALTAGNMTFVSGQIPVNPATGEMPATIEEQATQALTNLKAVLAAAGLEMSNVIKTAVFLADLKDFPVVNRIYESFFEAPYPARSCVQVAGIPKGALVEIECIAVKE